MQYQNYLVQLFMSKEKIFQGKTCLTEYQKDKNTIYFTFDGYVNVDETKSMYLKVLEFTKSNLVEAFVSDLRLVKGTFTQLNDWIITTMAPCKDRGLKITCMVVNEDAFTVFSAKSLAKKTSLLNQIFRSVEEAEEFIEVELQKIHRKEEPDLE